MLFRTFAFLCVLAAVSGASPGAAQTIEKGAPRAAADEGDGFGLLITPGVLNKLIDRAVERMATEYGFDEAQTAEIQRVLKEKVPAFFRENQKDATRLLNDFLDAQLENEAPSAEFVAGWAQRAAPLLSKGREFLGVVTEDMRNYMTDDQQARMDATLAAVEVGVGMLDKRLNVWAEGGFDPAREWHRNPGVREADIERARTLERAMIAARDAKMQAAFGTPTPQVAAAQVQTAESPEQQAAEPVGTPPAATPKSIAKQAEKPAAPRDEWEVYVDEFTLRYALDNTQEQKARTVLADLVRQRENYMSGKAQLLEQLGKQYNDSKTQEQFQAAEAQRQKLMAPVDRMFQTLKERLDKLPTRDQRRKAAESGAPVAKPGATKPPEKRSAESARP